MILSFLGGYFKTEYESYHHEPLEVFHALFGVYHVQLISHFLFIQLHVLVRLDQTVFSFSFWLSHSSSPVKKKKKVFSLFESYIWSTYSLFIITLLHNCAPTHEVLANHLRVRFGWYNNVTMLLYRDHFVLLMLSSNVQIQIVCSWQNSWNIGGKSAHTRTHAVQTTFPLCYIELFYSWQSDPVTVSYSVFFSPLFLCFRHRSFRPYLQLP